MASQLLSAFTFSLVVVSAIAEQSAVIHTNLGPIQGVREIVKGKPVDVYYGIPYAKPPVKNLRFKHPKPAEPWTEVRETATKPNSCFQKRSPAASKFPGIEMWNPNTPLSEDCLYLNVWVPRGFGSTSPRATMIWIYGGIFFYWHIHLEDLRRFQTRGYRKRHRSVHELSPGNLGLSLYCY